MSVRMFVAAVAFLARRMGMNVPAIMHDGLRSELHNMFERLLEGLVG